MMVTKRDWETAYGDVVASGRTRIEPPTPEEMAAYASGELSEREAERIREALGFYPELAASLSEDDDSDDDEPILSASQLAEDWQSLQRRMPPRAPHEPPVHLFQKPTPVWQWATAASLALFALSGALYLRSLTTISRLEAEFRKPRPNVERVVLFENVSRGSSPIPQTIDLGESTKYIVLTLTLVDPAPAQRFRVEIRDLDRSSVAWSGEVFLGSDGTFTLEVPRSFLQSPTYSVALFAGGKPQPFASYAFTLR
jgi:hypothetical protein